MTYLEAVGYLNTETAEGIKPDISRMSKMCRDLGHPEKSFHVIHVTGTNGKTSTARMISAILSGLGFKTALYTSPHLVSYTERMSIDGVEITPEEFGVALEAMIPVINSTNRAGLGGLVTQFEALTAMAFSWFAQMSVDVAVIEVGMGGRWDATNVAKADVAVITNIALEHTDRLGTTIEAIAGEKSGVIKNGTTVITGVDQPSALSVIVEQCRLQGAGRKFYGLDIDLIRSEAAPDGARLLTIKGLHRTYTCIPLNLKGAHQAINAVMAIAAVESLLDHLKDRETFSFGETLTRVIPTITSPGRLETVEKRPQLVLDGAHNPAGAASLAAALKSEFEYDKLILVLAVLEDKDADGIIRTLVPLADRVITAAARSPRALDADKLAEKVERFGKNITAAASVAEALVQARREARADDMILVTGSLYTVGEAKETLK
jgi:dihydrofolate synthase/folylpolyglutamate synthase